MSALQIRARRILAVLPDGATEPLLVRAEDGSDWIVKPGAVAIPDAPNEWLAASLAPSWGVRVPEPAIVAFPEALCAAMEVADRGWRGRQSLAARQIRAAGGLAFGGRWLSGQLVQGAADLEAAGLQADAARVRAFDAFIGNLDRTEDNANLLICGGGLVAIDHAPGFGWLWGGSDGGADGEPHIAARWPLAPAPPVNDGAIAAAVASLPEAWRRGREEEELCWRIGARWDVARGEG